MKNKEIISGAVGGVFFAVPYLVLSAPLLPSLAIGVAAIGASSLVLSGNPKIKGFVKPFGQVLDDAKKDVKHISEYSRKIKDKEIKASLNSIVTTTNKIIDTVKENPKKAEKIDSFFEYYLPTVEKIAERYEEISSKNITSKEGTKFMESAKEMLKEADGAFDKILSSLYKTEIIDADADMKVFNTMLGSDGMGIEDIKIERREDNNE